LCQVVTLVPLGKRWGFESLHSHMAVMPLSSEVTSIGVVKNDYYGSEVDYRLCRTRL